MICITRWHQTSSTVAIDRSDDDSPVDHGGCPGQGRLRSRRARWPHGLSTQIRSLVQYSPPATKRSPYVTPFDGIREARLSPNVRRPMTTTTVTLRYSGAVERPHVEGFARRHCFWCETTAHLLDDQAATVAAVRHQYEDAHNHTFATVEWETFAGQRPADAAFLLRIALGQSTLVARVDGQF
jgi:hypothetical protein